ncbi:hypothetical protein SAMN04488565_2147 [Leucobacter chromiiresistens]|uniref:Uncharacterized protein n=2 Tax=Leucobacter chromiiresistens TaxID=1079994 RepID=A0A1H0ZXG1_9MICO|nr:hypothetical protein SAMN04488565_2147 [Leucobacter chromiiresistens]
MQRARLTALGALFTAAPLTLTASSGGAAGSFCDEYDAAGGTLATPGLFQVGMPAETTAADLAERMRVLDAATPPEDIAAPWADLRDLYDEALGLAEAAPAGGVVSDPRIFEIVEELDAPASAVREYLDAHC